MEALEIMLEAARAEGLGKWQVSAGYRSWAEQESMLNYRVNTYLKKNPDWSRSRARRAALRTVAEPGASEHHLGLSFDVNVQGGQQFLQHEAVQMAARPLLGIRVYRPVSEGQGKDHRLCAGGLAYPLCGHGAQPDHAG